MTDKLTMRRRIEALERERNELANAVGSAIVACSLAPGEYPTRIVQPALFAAVEALRRDRDEWKRRADVLAKSVNHWATWARPTCFQVADFICPRTCV